MSSVDVKKRLHLELGFSREVGLKWIQAARDGNMRTIRDLIDAFQKEGSGAVFRLLHYDGHSTTAGFVGNTALHWACANGDTTMVRYLLENGAAVNGQNNGLSTPLHTACSNNQSHILDILLRSGASPFLVDCCGDTPAQVLPPNAVSGMREIVETSELIMGGTEVENWPLRDVERVASVFGLQGSLNEIRKRCVEVASRAVVAQQEAIVKSDEAMSFLSRIRRHRPLVEEGEKEELEEIAKKFREQGNAFFVQGDHKQAIRLFTSGINVLPDAKLYCNRAASYLALGLFQNAAQDSQLALANNPLWVKPYFRLGCSLRGLGRFQEAERILTDALKLVDVSENDRESINFQLTHIKGELAQTKTLKPAPFQGRKPWFDCSVCENKTRDRGELGCCEAAVCNTCIRRAGGCPICN